MFETKDIGNGYKLRSDGFVFCPFANSWHRGTPIDVSGGRRKKPKHYYKLLMPNKRGHNYVHRLVAQNFVPNPRPLLFDQVDHINGDSLDNDQTNLRWVTRQLNNMNRRQAGKIF